jgi:hypothetical protein
MVMGLIGMAIMANAVVEVPHSYPLFNRNLMAVSLQDFLMNVFWPVLKYNHLDCCCHQ